MKADGVLSVLLRATFFVGLLSLPSSAALSAFFTVNAGDARVRQWNPVTGAFIGDPALLTDAGLPFGNCSDIEWDGEFFYGIRPGDPRVMRFDSSGTFIGDSALLTDHLGQVPLQVGLAYDGSFLYSIAQNDARIRQYTLNGQFIGDYANLGNELGPVTDSVGLAKDAEYFYTISSGSALIRRFGLNGQYIDDFLTLKDAGVAFSDNTGLAIAPVPEASSALLLLCSCGTFLLHRRATRS